MSTEHKIIQALKAHPDEKMREVGEKLARIKEHWTAEELRDVVMEMLEKAKKP